MPCPLRRFSWRCCCTRRGGGFESRTKSSGKNRTGAAFEFLTATGVDGNVLSCALPPLAEAKGSKSMHIAADRRGGRRPGIQPADRRRHLSEGTRRPEDHSRRIDPGKLKDPKSARPALREPCEAGDLPPMRRKKGRRKEFVPAAMAGQGGKCGRQLIFPSGRPNGGMQRGKRAGKAVSIPEGPKA